MDIIKLQRKLFDITFCASELVSESVYSSRRDDIFYKMQKTVKKANKHIALYYELRGFGNTTEQEEAYETAEEFVFEADVLLLELRYITNLNLSQLKEKFKEELLLLL